MKKYASIGLSILVLTSVIIGMTLWVRAFHASIQNYRSPLGEVDLSAQPSPLTKTSKVVMVLISGLGYDASQTLDLPVFEQLERVGANAAVQSMPPTYSQTAWATLISGAPPDTNDAPPVDIPFEDLRLLEVDTIFARAHEAKLQTALLGIADSQRESVLSMVRDNYVVLFPSADVTSTEMMGRLMGQLQAHGVTLG